MGEVRVDGMPVHFSETDWQMHRGAPCLGEHNEHVLTTLLGISAAEVQALEEEGVL
jgi:crotonobetainyl-CoA:carnitine CoA-transferase CaiB-like acyl-CoA transferase